jgi:hypothetical protein
MKKLFSLIALAFSSASLFAQTNGEYVITNHGAVGDGWFDNATIINNLINGLPNTGGSIVIPNGTFRVNSPIIVTKSYVTIRGMGPGSKISVANGASQGILAPNQTPRISGLTIRDLQIQGLDWNIYRTGVSVDRANDGLFITNVTCNNMNRGFFLRECDAGRIVSNSVTQCESSLFMTGGFSTLVSRNSFSGYSGGTAVELVNLDRNEFTGNTISPDGRTSLRLSNAHNCNVSGNTITTYFTGCIEITGNMNTFSGNNISAVTVGGNWVADPAGRNGSYGLVRIAGNDNVFASSSIMSWQPVNDTRMNIVSGDRNVLRDLVIAANGSNKKVNVGASTTWARVTHCGWPVETQLNGNSTVRVTYDP